MAYRSIRRAIGDTSLERKIRWMFGVTLGLLIAGSFWWYRTKTDELIYQGNIPLGEGLVGAALTELHAQSLNNNQLEEDPDSVRFFGRLVEELRSKSFNWYAILPPNPGKENPPQFEHEWEMLEEWTALSQTLHSDAEIAAAPVKPEGRSITRGDKKYYQYYQPIFAKTFCIDCHKTIGKAPREDLREGDLLAVMRVEVDQQQVINAQNQNRVILISVAIVTAFLSMLALWGIVKTIVVKPLMHLRDVANAVREGNIDQRAEVNTGDEFQELAAAFNRMVRQLLSQQHQLQDANATLDKNLDELAQANLKLFEMNKIKSDFLSTVSHELRTPLNSILGFSEVLSDAESLDGKQKRYAHNIQKSGKMLLEMIDDILNLAKIESGKIKVQPSEFRIESVVIDLCDLARPLAEKKNIDLICDVAPGLEPLRQDQAKVQQILNNLLSNAIKFTPDGGRITVTAERDDLGDLRLLVDDTGVGISPDEQSLVFEKFRQGSNVAPGGDAMKREYSGTGLGLSIVKELCRLLGGEISLASELGKGSTFRVRLPWVLDEERQVGAELREELDELSRHTRGPIRLEQSATPPTISSQ